VKTSLLLDHSSVLNCLQLHETYFIFSVVSQTEWCQPFFLKHWRTRFIRQKTRETHKAHRSSNLTNFLPVFFLTAEQKLRCKQTDAGMLASCSFQSL